MACIRVFVRVLPLITITFKVFASSVPLHYDTHVPALLWTKSL